MPSFWEKISVDGQEMDVYTSAPSGSGPFPAVIVSQHGGGVDKFVQTICDRFAEAGLAGVAPDLFHRITEEQVQSSGLTRRELLSDPQTIADINATVDWMQNHPAIDGQRIGITGFCMGGREAWLGAATNSNIKAAHAETGYSDAVVVDGRVLQQKVDGGVDVGTNLRIVEMLYYGAPRHHNTASVEGSRCLEIWIGGRS